MKFLEAKEKLQTFFENEDKQICVITGKWGVGKTTLLWEVFKENDKEKYISLLGIDESQLISHMINEDYSFISELKTPLIPKLGPYYKNEVGEAGMAIDFNSTISGLKNRKRIRNYKEMEVFVFDDCESYRSDHDSLIRLAMSLTEHEKKVVLIYNKIDQQNELERKLDFDRLEEKLNPLQINLSEPDLHKFKEMLVGFPKEKYHLFQNLRIINKIFVVYKGLMTIANKKNKIYFTKLIIENFGHFYLLLDNKNLELFKFLSGEFLNTGSLLVSDENNDVNETKESERPKEFLEKWFSSKPDAELIYKFIVGDKLINYASEKIKNNPFNFNNRMFHQYIDKVLNEISFEPKADDILQFKIVNEGKRIAYTAAQRIQMFWEIAFLEKMDIEVIAKKSFSYLNKHVNRDNQNFLFINAFTKKEDFNDYINNIFHGRGIRGVNFLGAHDFNEFTKFINDSFWDSLFIEGEKYFKEKEIIFGFKNVIRLYCDNYWDYLGETANDVIRKLFVNWVNSESAIIFLKYSGLKIRSEYKPIYQKVNFIYSFSSKWNLEQKNQVKIGIEKHLNSLNVKNEVIKSLLENH